MVNLVAPPLLTLSWLPSQRREGEGEEKKGRHCFMTLQVCYYTVCCSAEAPRHKSWMRYTGYHQPQPTTTNPSLSLPPLCVRTCFTAPYDISATILSLYPAIKKGLDRATPQHGERKGKKKFLDSIHVSLAAVWIECEVSLTNKNSN